MTSLKLLGLLLVAGAAGAGFAAVTTSAIPQFTAPRQAAPVIERPGQPAGQEQSWLEQGIDALDRPAWPFGTAQSDDQADFTPPPPHYPDHAYRLHRYDDEDEYDSGARMHEPTEEDEEDDAYAPARPSPAAPAMSDRAADAASRAAQAARDVSAAEQGL